MAGRNRQPLSVIQGKGRSKHITKAEAKKRMEHEERMRGPTENVEPPKYLTATQKKEFNEIASKLVALGIFSELDVDNLARYIDSKTEYNKITKAMRKLKLTEENLEMYSTLRINRNTLFNECRAAASDLGLTITSRLKLVIPDNKGDAPKSEFEQKFGDV